MTTHTNREAELETKLMIFHDLVYALGQRGGLKDDDVKKASKDIKQFIRQTHLDLLREVEQKITESKSPFNVGASEIAQAADNGWWQAIFDLTRKLKSIKEKYER